MVQVYLSCRAGEDGLLAFGVTQADIDDARALPCWPWIIHNSSTAPKILEACIGGWKCTAKLLHISGDVGRRQLDSIERGLVVLVNNGLIETTNAGLHQTTDKGRLTLRAFKASRKMSLRK